MIGVTLQGRLGNQLFQYAFAYSAAKKLNTSFYIDQSKQKLLICECFDVPYQWSFFLENHIFNIRGYRNLFSYRLMQFYYKAMHKLLAPVSVNYSPDVDSNEVITGINDHVLYEGYFQSEDYFINDNQAIKNLFTIKKKMAQTYQQKYLPLFKGKQIVTVHIRRDDYFNLGHFNLGGDDLSLPMYYYHHVISLINAHNVLFVFISDDIAFVKKEFAYLDNKIFSEDNLITDFQHLLNADICIIANSTFSWWGAWLNNNPHKKVYAPRYFMGHRVNKDWPQGIYPATWNQIDVNESACK
jgi:hypothetical protein